MKDVYSETKVGKEQSKKIVDKVLKGDCDVCDNSTERAKKIVNKII